MKCTYDLAWVGKCGKDGCSAHSNLKCVSCGEKATHQCAETSQFVCGYDLCDDCEHTIRDNGCSSGGKLPEGVKGHCRKTEQVYKPWYMTEEATNEA